MHPTHQGYSNRKTRRCDDADRRVSMEITPGGQAVDQHRGAKAPEPGAHVDVQAEQMADHRAAEHRMRQPVADIAHLAQYDVYAEESTQTAHQQCRYQAMHKKLVLQRLNEERHRLLSAGDVPGSFAGPRVGGSGSGWR